MGMMRTVRITGRKIAYNGDGHNDEDGDGGDEQEEEGRLRIRVSLEGMWF